MIEHGFGIKRFKIYLESVIDYILNPCCIVLNAICAHVRSLLFCVAMACAQVEITLSSCRLIRDAWPMNALLNLFFLLFVIESAVKLRVDCPKLIMKNKKQQ